MKIKQYVNRIRSKNKATPKQKICSVLWAIAWGIVLGIVAKLADNVYINSAVSNIGFIVDNIGGRLGIWIFTATLLAMYAVSPQIAAIRIFFYFLSMLLVYYLYTIYFLHFFPKTEIIFWSLCAFISPICAFIMWYARGKGFISDICAALPVSVISSEAYVSCKSMPLLQGVYVCFILILLFSLHKSKRHYIFILVISGFLFLLLVKTKLLTFLFGGWNMML